MNSSQKDLIFQLYSSSQTVFTLRGIALMTGESQEGTLARRINYHVRNGKLLNLRKGIYAKPGYNPEEFACLLFKPSYISLEYVLQKAGVVFQYDSRLTSVSYLSRAVEVDGHEYQYRRIKGEILVETKGIEQRNTINIATTERAFLDVMYLNPDYYFDNLNPLNRKRVFELLPIYQSKRMTARVSKLLGK